LALAPKNPIHPYQGNKMSLLLVELDLATELEATLEIVRNAAANHDSELIEVQVTADKSHVFIIIEYGNKVELVTELKGTDLVITDVAEVRLVGADIAEIKALRPKGNYLVEWDLPEGLTMDTYLARKQEKTPLYAEVPEVSFLRTYVREDMVKCLCFYDGESEADVKRARDVVSAPIDRLHRIEGANAN
jgi:hypothetical protein